MSLGPHFGPGYRRHSVFHEDPSNPPLRVHSAGLFLGLRPANERQRYFVTASLIDWAQAWNQPCISYWNTDDDTRLVLM